MKKYLFAIVLFVSLTSAFTCVRAADEKPAGDKKAAKIEPPPEQIVGAHPQAVYAIAGKDCPPGSHLYHGPEQIEIQKTGFSYCAFNRRYAYFRKTSTLTQCPDGSDPVKPAVDDGKVIWCDMPNAQFTSTGVYMRPDMNTLEYDLRRQGRAGSTPAKGSIEPPNLSDGPVKGTPNLPVATSKPAELPDLLKGQKIVAPPVVNPSSAPPAAATPAVPSDVSGAKKEPSAPQSGADSLPNNE